MIRDTHERDINPADVKFVINDCNEHTLAFGKKTLTVFGIPDIEEIARVLAKYSDSNIEHIHFGAERTFTVSTLEEMDDWIEVIKHFLTLDYWCTLEVDLSLIQLLQESQIHIWNRFIPLISVKVPFVYELGYNACLKIDDIQFNHSNTGVWCHQFHDLLDYKKYTAWSDYKDELTILPEDISNAT